MHSMRSIPSCASYSGSDAPSELPYTASPPPSPSPSPSRPTEDASFRFRAAPSTPHTPKSSPPRVRAPARISGGRERLRMLGEWRMGESLGRGTSGSVRLARSIETGEFAAVKKVLRYPSGHKLAASVHREISLMKLVAPHPHVLQLFDVFESRSHFYLVTEFCPVGELFHYVAKEVLSPLQIQRLFLELVSALLHLRRFSIAHRDIKPDNLLLYRDEQGELSLKLGDLGMATYQPDDQLLTTSCGSPHYAAPEVIKAIPYDGLLADVWSAGVVLYALFARMLPFDDENNPALFEKIKSGRFEMHADIPGAAQDLIARCLVVDPRRRYTLDDVLSHPFLRPHPSRPGTLAHSAIYPPSPPRAPIPREDDPLDPVVLGCLAVVLKVATRGEAERLVRTDELAQHFYTVLLGFRQPRPSTPSEQLGRSFFDDTSFSISAHTATDSSSENTRSISAPDLARFPMPPTSTDFSASVAQRQQLEFAAAVAVQLDSSPRHSYTDDSRRSTPSGDGSHSSYESINREYVFPPPLPPPTAPLPPLPTAAKKPEVTTSAPPCIESFAVHPFSPAPLAVAFPSLALAAPEQAALAATATQSLPATPVVNTVQPAFLSASHPPLVSEAEPTDDRSIRPRLSMHQRIRSLFQGPTQKRASVSSVPEGAVVRLERVHPPPLGGILLAAALAAPPPPTKRQSVSTPLHRQASAPLRPSTAESIAARTASPAPSTRSNGSMLKRSAAYPSLSRALHGEPPLSPSDTAAFVAISPELCEFAEILALGASGPGVSAVRELEAAADAKRRAQQQGEVQVYQDPPSTPRPSAAQRQLQLQMPLTGDTANALAPTARQRLLSKASTSLLAGRGSRAPRRPPLPMPPPRQQSAPAVPTVTVAADDDDEDDPSDPESPIALVDSLRQYPFRSVSRARSADRAGSRSGTVAGGWRRFSLSIRVPSTSPSMVSDAAGTTSAAGRSARSPRVGGDYTVASPVQTSSLAPSSALRRPHSSSSLSAPSLAASTSSAALLAAAEERARALERDLARAEGANAALRSALAEKEGELARLKTRRRSSCTRSEEEEEAQSAHSAGGDEKEGSVREGEWMGGARAAFGDESEGSLGC
ncbi:serine/threonine-protein kinase gin4 [Rhodotorula kratochvilovae]